MNDRIKWVAILAAAAALLIGGCGGDEPASEAVQESREAKSDAPDAAVEAAVAALRDNDIKAFMVALLPPEEMERIEQRFEAERQVPPSEEDRAEFARTMQKLTVDDAEEQLMSELEPNLQQMAMQVPMAVGFGQMMVMSGIQENQDLSPQQKEAATNTANAVFAKLQTVNFGDEEKAREAIGIVTEYARALELETADDVQALSFDEALEKGGLMMEGGKKILALYGFDLDPILASVDAEVVSETGDTATVNLTYDLFGEPQRAETTMVRMDGRWYGGDIIEQLKKASEAPAVPLEAADEPVALEDEPVELEIGGEDDDEG